jgi:hypothetical protein
MMAEEAFVYNAVNNWNSRECIIVPFFLKIDSPNGL